MPLPRVTHGHSVRRQVIQARNLVDVAVVGGGPAGLLLASKIARERSVVVLERGQLRHTRKYWVTTTRRLAAHGLEHAGSATSSRVLVGTFLGSEAIAEGDLQVVQQETLLEELDRRCREAGATVLDQTELLSFRCDAEALVLQTTAGAVASRLLVDASGGASPVAAAFRLHRLWGFFAVFGVHLTGVTHLRTETVLGYVSRLSHPPEFIEVVPTGPESAYVALLRATPRLENPAGLRERLERYLKHNPFLELTRETQRGPTRYGAIPIGALRRREIRGVIAFGEAAMMHPPLLGTAFNEALEHADLVAAAIAQSLRRQPRGVARVTTRFPILKRVSDRLQGVVARALLRGSVESVDRLTGVLSELDPKLLFRLYSNELAWTDLPRLTPVAPRLLYEATRPAR